MLTWLGHRHRSHAFLRLRLRCSHHQKPTRDIEPRLLGDWKSADGKDTLKVVKLDDRNYIASLNGDLYRVYHSDVAQTPLVTIVDLTAERAKYFYYSWRLAEDGSLHVRLVNDNVIPDETKTSGQVRDLLKQNLQNPELFGPDEQMIRVK